MSAPTIQGTLTLADGGTVTFTLSPEGTYQQQSSGSADVLGDTVDLMSALAEQFADYASEHRCPACGDYVVEPDDLRTVDHDAHCRECAEECNVCRKQEAAERRYETYGRW